MTTQQHIARLAKTSLKTVSRVINNDPLVNAKTRARVEAVIAKVGYEPSQAARMMRSQKSNIIGFLADKVATRSSSIELVRGAQDVAWERGKQMMLFNIEQGNRSETLANAQLAAFRAEAVIYAAMYHQQVDIEANDIPHVLLNCFEAAGRFTTIVPDDYRLGYDLTQEIIRRGYRRPVFLNLSEKIVASHLRARGFVDAAREHGLDVSASVHVVTDPPDEGGGYHIDSVVPKLLEGAERPDLLICGQDLMALPVYFVLNRLGLTIGRDIAVASFDNLQPIAGLLQPSLSTMELPYYEMGRAAMIAALDADTAERVQLIRGTFIDRQSM